jgi:hypothetical protein
VARRARSSVTGDPRARSPADRIRGDGTSQAQPTATTRRGHRPLSRRHQAGCSRWRKQKPQGGGGGPRRG